LFEFCSLRLVGATAEDGNPELPIPLFGWSRSL